MAISKIYTAQVKKLDDYIKNRILAEFRNTHSIGLKENQIINKSEKVFNDLLDEGINYDPSAVRELLMNELRFDDLIADIAYQ